MLTYFAPKGENTSPALYGGLMLRYYSHSLDGRVKRVYVVEADSSDEQQLLAFAAMWNRDYPNSVQRVEEIYRVEIQAGGLPVPPAFYPPKPSRASSGAPSVRP
jgi:hypothetical protein